MTKRGRKPGFRMSEAHRDKIRNSNILNALVEHVEGRRNMSPSQVTAGLGLLKKVMPDLSATDITASINRTSDEMSDDELIAIARAGRTNGAGKAASASKPDPVH